MSQQAIVRNRIIIYLVIVIACVVTLYNLGSPATYRVQDGQGQIVPGGVLSQARIKEELAEAQLGDIDPTSSAMKLATLGLRGVAITLLWNQSREFEKRHDWNNVIATSHQITRLEPHFITIWEFLSWQLSYNASAEFDDYRERYRWVIRGFDFINDGIGFNRKNPILFHKAGWIISQKIGIADEKEQYRRLLREDDKFFDKYTNTGMVPLSLERDNWLVGREWYHRAEENAPEGTNIGNQSGPLFFSARPKNLIHYAEWLALEGRFEDDGEENFIKNAWKDAQKEWHFFGEKEFYTAIPKNDGSGEIWKTTLTKYLNCIEREKELIEELKNLSPGFYDDLVIENWNKLLERSNGEQMQAALLNWLTYEPSAALATVSPPDEESLILRKYLDEKDAGASPGWRERFKESNDQVLAKSLSEDDKYILDIPELLLNERERDILAKANAIVSQMHREALMNVKVDPKLLADKLPGADVRRKALEIRAEFIANAEDKQKSNLFRDIINYPHWDSMITVEQQDETIQARRHVFDARRKYRDGEQSEANRLWLGAFENWEKLIHKPGFEFVGVDPQFARDILFYVERYVIILDAEEKLFPEKFPLQDYVRERISAEDMQFSKIGSVLEYVEKNYYEKGDYAKSAEYLATITQYINGINSGFEYMKLAPLPDFRDLALKAAAMYVNSLRQEKQERLPASFGLQHYVNLMLQHDTKQFQAMETSNAASALLHEEKNEEAQAKLEEALQQWREILEKYPLIYYQPETLYYGVIAETVQDYRQVLERQGKVLPEDFDLKEFL